MANIAILGSGGFGISLAATLFKYEHTVCLWSPFEQEIELIRTDGENKKLLPGVIVDKNIELTTNPACVKGRDIVIFAVPSFATRQTAKLVAPYVDSTSVVVNVSKGIDEQTLERLSEVIAGEISTNDIVVLSGPSHAEEIARGIPTTIVAACKNRASAQYIQDVMINTNLRVYANDDIIGVELGGAFKNIIAVCAGVCVGLELGDNTRAALITRGLAEIARLGKAMGAKVETFTGLTGMGDLIVTCSSMHSRNRRCGVNIGKGMNVDDAIAKVGMTVEGISAAKCAYKLAKQYGVEMPITEQLCSVINGEQDIKTAISDLMGRPSRHESEKVWVRD